MVSSITTSLPRLSAGCGLPLSLRAIATSNFFKILIRPTADRPRTSAAMGALDTALATVTDARAQFGASQNRLEATVSNLAIKIESFSAANSQIVDVDVAFETAELTKNSIMQQAAISILAQANLQPASALALISS